MQEQETQNRKTHESNQSNILPLLPQNIPAQKTQAHLEPAPEELVGLCYQSAV